MFIAVIVVILLLLAVFASIVAGKAGKPLIGYTISGALGIFAIVILGLSTFTIVGPSQRGVVIDLGEVQPDTLAEGFHFVAPWKNVKEIFVGTDTARTVRLEAASRDLQTVHAVITANYSVIGTEAAKYYKLDPGLGHKENFIAPALQEVFKAVASKYSAEELVTKRATVSDEVLNALGLKLTKYYVRTSNVNLVDFGFSKTFDESIEKKVQATQKAEAALNDLARIKYEAQSRIEEAKGEAEAIRIQAEAVSKAGGADYVHLQAIAKWNGEMPQYVTAGAPLPFIGVAGK